MEEFGSRYKDRYIVIDSPPPLLTSEPLVMANYVDAILVVIKHERSSRFAIKEIIDILGKDKIVGVVVNHYKHRGFSGVYKKYGAYYGYT